MRTDSIDSPSAASVAQSAHRHGNAEMFILSALNLYLELVLIRWVGTEIRIFAYLGNLVLVVCFFGVGLGCYLASRPVRNLKGKTLDGAGAGTEDAL